ncbi:hypothetical protein O3M35_005520 [Rhynocoris fuscipes]|uniref:Thymidylate kinase n=1 Tax=Rhynocoris fuscipes TaxID=488301 RepID=A0AAW1DL61_9HEMI
MENRGALIVIEGVDRCGKTTQCKKLVEKLKENNIKAEFIHFPDRTTYTGKLINDYLSKNVELSDQAIHLLFSANRWELEPFIKKKLLDGINLIVDRYSFSGVAYSAAKQSNMDLDWFKNPEIGLPKPDCVLYLQLEQLVANGREGFGEERYENNEFQKSVALCFDKLKDETWKVINANKTIEKLSEELYSIINEVIEKSKNSPLLTLW